MTVPVSPHATVTTEALRTDTGSALDRQPWHVLAGPEIARTLGVDPGQGLSAAEAAKRIGQYGPNKFAEAKTEPRWHAFLRQYRDPMQIVLLVAGLGSIWPVHELGTGLVIVS